MNVSCDRCSEFLGKRFMCDEDNCLSSGKFLGQISWNGALSSDMAYFGGAPVEGTPNIAQEYGSRFVFGCQMNYNNNTVISRWVRKRANGVISFSPSEHSLMKQLRQSNMIQNANFALCFYSRLSIVGPAGVLSLGGYTLVEDDESSPLLYVKTNFKNNYAVFIEQFFLHSEIDQKLQDQGISYANDLNNDEKGAIIDAGSPVSFLGSDKFGKEFRSTWKTITGNDFPEDGGTFLPTDIPSLPTIKIQLKATGEKDDNTMRTRHKRQRQRKLEFGVSGTVGELDSQNSDDVLLTIPPQEYLDYDSDTLSYHVRLFIGSSKQPTILGGNLFRSNLLFFDLEQAKIGIATQSYCGRSAITNQDEEDDKDDSSSSSYQYDYNATDNEEEIDESTAGYVSPTSSSNEQSDSIEQKSHISNPVGGGGGGGSVITNYPITTMSAGLDENETTISSFSMNTTYYTAAIALVCLFFALSIYSCRRCYKTRRRRRLM